MRIKEEDIEVFCIKDCENLFKKGCYYKAHIEYNTDCILVWDANLQFGSRFSIENNIYISGKPLWKNHFEYFENYLITNRKKKIKQIYENDITTN